MPWKELCKVGIREDFVLRAIQPEANISELCREYGISRKTGYKWMRRYDEEGLAGLEDRSRRPHTSPHATPADIVARIVRIRTDHGWGPKKIRGVLERELKGKDRKVPTVSTIKKVLVRTGQLQPMRRRERHRSNGPTKAPVIEVKRPNDLWTVDFKGWWLSMDKRRCEPLTIRDAHSRFLLEMRVVENNRVETVQKVFAEVFAKYGLPRAILSDNGPPFVSSHGELGLTRLSAWWTMLGIVHHRSRPGKPSDNGGHERMHRDIEKDVERFKMFRKDQMQEACNRWRHDFNCHRPHEALKGRTPSELYKPSQVKFPRVLAEYEYPEHFLVRRASKRGHISVLHRPGFVSYALHKIKLGLEPIEDLTFDVWLHHVKLGRIDMAKQPAKLMPIDWKLSALAPKMA